MPEPAAWFYVDEARTHAVRVRLEREPTLRLVIRESAFGKVDPDEEAYVETHLLAERWEARLHLLALERRLTLLGRYHKLAAGSAVWERVASGAAAGVGKLDLTPLPGNEDAPGVQFHHYANSASPHAVTLVGVPQPQPRGPRFVLARLDFSFPDVEGGHLHLVHAHLPPVVYRSTLASLHLELLEQGFERTVADKRSGVAGDPRWWAALQATLDAVLDRLLEGRVGKGVPADAKAKADIAAARAAVAGVVGQGGAFESGRPYEVEDEDGGPASAVRAKRGAKDFDHLDATLVNLLRDPKLVALQDRYLPRGETARLLEQGELAILEEMKALKARTPVAEWHLVSLLQASLLVRYATAKRGRKLDVDALELLKHAPAWL